MEVSDYTLHNESGDKDFDVTVYGTSGRPVIVFPEGDSSCTSWENGGMVETLSDLIDGGTAQLFATDSADNESWYFRDADPAYRFESLKGFYAYVENVLVPFVAEHAESGEPPVLVGTGIGALNAAVEMLRKPELFGGLLALSGSYDVRFFVDGDLDSAWDEFSPVALAANLGDGQVARLNEVPIAFVSGQHASETGIETQRVLDTIFAEKGVEATFEYWGYDVDHSWYWWREEARQLMPCVLAPNGLVDRKLVARVSAARVEAEHADQILQDKQERLSQAQERSRQAKDAARSATERLRREREVVASRKEAAEKAQDAAHAAWVRRDEAQRALDEAIAAGNTAQAEADKAAKELADAEWIAGEAKAASDHATAEKVDAGHALAKAESAVRTARESSRRAANAVTTAEERIEAERGSANATEEASEE